MEVKRPYNTFEATETALASVFDYLFHNAPDMWKLLKYIAHSDTPLLADEVTDEEKAQMVCNDPSDYYNADVVTQKNILFQRYNDEEYSVAVPQVRMWVDDIGSVDSYRGYCNIVFQIVVPNRQNQFYGQTQITSDRALSLVQAITQALNGVELPNSSLCSPLFINKSAPDGAGRNNGAVRQKQNLNYSGYFLCFSALI